MISKERLEELIEQGATVCNTYKDWDNVWHCRFGNVVQEENHLLFKENGSSLSVIMYDTNNLYETKEHAEWEWEFGCIERTERLELPIWEEFKNKKTKHVCFMGKDTFCFFELYEDKQKNRLILLDHDCDYEYFNEELTKENYTTACGLCKEFFLGEKK